MSSAETSLATKEIERSLASLQSRCQAIQVSTQDDYIRACELVKEGRSYIKDVGFKLDPGINSAKEHYDFLKNEKAKYVEPAKAIVSVAEQKAERWKADERRKAEEEQRRINEERRLEAARLAEEERKERDRIAIEERAERERQAAEERKERERAAEAARKAGDIGKREAERLKKEAAEEAERQKKLAREAEERERARAAEDAKTAAANVQEVSVAPNVPKVSGIKGRVNWKFKITDQNKIPRAYCSPDEVKIGALVRGMKDKAKAEQLIPGIEVYTEDSI